MIKQSLYAALAFAAGAAAVSAEAKVTVTGVPTTRVSYSDLDLANSAGHGALTVRVRRAATDLCAPVHVSTLSSFVQNRRCFKGALKMAQPQIERAIAIAKRGPVLAAMTGTITIQGGQ